MTATLWVNETEEDAIELGGSVELYGVLSEWAKAAGDGFFEDWPDLSGVVTQVERGDDCDPDWLADCRREAGEFLSKYKGKLGDRARWVLKQLIVG